MREHQVEGVQLLQGVYTHLYEAQLNLTGYRL